jgi:hypothetical protein
MSNTVLIDKVVNLSWIVGNLGSSFLEDGQPEPLEIIQDESEVTIRFKGSGETRSYGAQNVDIETPDGTKSRGVIPAMTFVDLKKGWLTFTLRDGTIVKRWYEEGYIDIYDEDPDWIVIPATEEA